MWQALVKKVRREKSDVRSRTQKAHEFYFKIIKAVDFFATQNIAVAPIHFLDLLKKHCSYTLINNGSFVEPMNFIGKAGTAIFTN